MSGTSRSGGDRAIRFCPGNGAPECPEYLEGDERAKFFELVKQIPQAILDKSDVHQLGSLAVALCQIAVVYKQMKHDPTDLKLKRSFVALCQTVNRASALYGLSPADRARIKTPVEEGEDPFAAYLKEAGLN